MSNPHPQPRQFIPNNKNVNRSNSKQRASNEINFVPKKNNEGFKPAPIQEQKHKSISNYNGQNNNFHFNANSINSTNSTNNNTNNNSSNLITSGTSINQANNQNSNAIQNNNTDNSNVNVIPSDNNNTSNNDTSNNNENNQLPPIQCPICNEKKFTFYSECIFHIIMAHSYQSCIKKSIDSESKCKHCKKLLSNDNEIIVQHMYDYHRDKFFETILDGIMKKNARFNKLKNYLNKVLPVKEEPRIIRRQIDEKKIENYNEEEDEDYVNFIASSIHTNGLSSNDTVRIQNVQPISNSNQQTKAEIIDHNFWVKLNNITERLSNSGQIETNENNYFCYICNKSFDSHVKLLSHCWNKHQNLK